MALNSELREMIAVSKSNMSAKTSAAFKEYLARPKMVGELDMMASALSDYGLECEAPEFSISEHALHEVSELAFELESNGRRLNNLVRAFGWLNHLGVDAVREKSIPVTIESQDGKTYEGHWCLEKGKHGTGINTLYVFLSHKVDIDFVGKGISSARLQSQVEKAMLSLIEELEVAA